MPATTLSKAIAASARRRVLFFSTASALSVVLAGAAAATEANTPDTGAAPATGALEEIVVTATRREENISKVPISITALSQDTLDQKGIRDITEMVRFTPGVSIDTSGTNAISIRGISSSGGAGTTGIYIDDTPIQMRALGFNPDDTLPKTFDLDRVEVLRGPQGTLFGAGSEGGTVRYIMVQPSVTSESSYARSEVAYTANRPARAMRSASLTADPSSMACSAFARASGTASTAAGSTASMRHRRHHGPGRESSEHHGRAFRAAVSAGRQREDHAEHHVPVQAPARPRHVLAGLLQSRARDSSTTPRRSGFRFPTSTICRH